MPDFFKATASFKFRCASSLKKTHPAAISRHPKYISPTTEASFLALEKYDFTSPGTKEYCLSANRSAERNCVSVHSPLLRWRDHPKGQFVSANVPRKRSDRRLCPCRHG